jgi:hypothetical protein
MGWRVQPSDAATTRCVSGRCCPRLARRGGSGRSVLTWTPLTRVTLSGTPVCGGFHRPPSHTRGRSTRPSRPDHHLRRGHPGLHHVRDLSSAHLDAHRRHRAHCRRGNRSKTGPDRVASRDVGHLEESLVWTWSPVRHRGLDCSPSQTAAFRRESESTPRYCSPHGGHGAGPRGRSADPIPGWIGPDGGPLEARHDRRAGNRAAFRSSPFDPRHE